LNLGVYDFADPTTTIDVFSGVMSVGDSVTISTPSYASFGFFLKNTSADFSGPFTFYSNSVLNSGGLDSIIAAGLGSGAYALEFEDFFLPVSGGGDSDLFITVSAISPAVVPLPASVVFLSMGLGGLVLVGRKRSA